MITILFLIVSDKVYKVSPFVNLFEYRSRISKFVFFFLRKNAPNKYLTFRGHIISSGCLFAIRILIISEDHYQ